MRVKGYDWIPGGKPSTAVGNPQPARLTIHEDIEARLHAFTAIDEPTQNQILRHIIQLNVTVCYQEGDPPIVIRPTSGGNIHSFIAKSSCAILDLLAPPYDLSHPGKQAPASVDGMPHVCRTVAIAEILHCCCRQGLHLLQGGF